MTDTNKQDFRFNYEKYQNKSIKIEVIDKMIVTILDATGTFALIILAVKVFALSTLYIMRGKIIDEQERIEKQNYEIRRANTNRDTLEKDDLDELRSQA